MATVSPTLPLDRPKPETRVRSQGSGGVGAASPESDPEAWGRHWGRRARAGGHGPRPPKRCSSRYRLAPSLSPASQRKQNTTKSKNKHGKTDTRSDTHRSKVTRSTST